MLGTSKITYVFNTDQGKKTKTKTNQGNEMMT